jgi:hypothetical protein
LACGLAVEHERGMGNPLVGSGRGDIGRREWLAEKGGSGSPAYRAVRFWLRFGLRFTQFRTSATLENF